jgi:hypothetical protein
VPSSPSAKATDEKWGRLPEAHLIGSAVLGLLAGRTVWTGPMPVRTGDEFGAVKRSKLELFWQLIAAELEQESSALEVVRARGQFLLTALIALVGVAVASYPIGKGSVLWESSATVLWAFGMLALVVATLASASIVAAKKFVGVVTVSRMLKHSPGASLRWLCQEGLVAIDRTRLTKNAAITVFRDSVLIAFVGIAAISGSYLIHLTLLAPDLSPTVVVIHNGHH